MDRDLTIEWRGAFSNAELNALHAEGFAHRVLTDDWWGQVHRHSLGWVCVRRGEPLVGFVNVAWDGGVHAFILDTLVAIPERRHGIATAMITRAADEARAAAGKWSRRSAMSTRLRMAARRLRPAPARVLLRRVRVHAGRGRHDCVALANFGHAEAWPYVQTNGMEGHALAWPRS